MGGWSAVKLLTRLGFPSGLSVIGRKPILTLPCVIFIVYGTLLARTGVSLADSPQFNAHYLYAYLGPCRPSGSATCRRQPGRRAPVAVQRPPANDAVVTEFGPGVRLQGSAESLRLEVHGGTIGAVLAAMGRAFNVHYRSSTALDDDVSGTYAGSLSRVIGRLLDGYDYAIKHDGSALEVAVFGRSRGIAGAVPPSPAKSVSPAEPASAAEPAAVARVRCGRSAGHRAACRPI
jgi:hypothetical protein